MVRIRGVAGIGISVQNAPSDICLGARMVRRPEREGVYRFGGRFHVFTVANGEA